jgi:hypothetical protein
MTSENIKRIFSRTWFQIIIAGIILGVLFIIADDHFFSASTKSYDGPVQIEKGKSYITKISLSEDVVDFGKSKEGDTLTRKIIITNSGNDPLFIYKSKGSCDCIAALVNKELISPGDTTLLRVYFDTKGRKGPQLRKIELTCNTDPAEVFITIKTDVE